MPNEYFGFRLVALGVIFIVSMLVSACSSETYYMKASIIKASIEGKCWNLTDEPEPMNYRAEFNELDNELSVEGWNNNPKHISGILIKIENPRKGFFYLRKDSNSQAKIWVIETGKKKAYRTDIEGCSGKVTITEFTSSLVKGRFFFTAHNEQGELLEVRNGKFAIPLDLLDF